MALILGVVVLLFLLAIPRIVPFLGLGLWMLVVHAPGKAFLGLPWQDWEWGIVALAFLPSLVRLARKQKSQLKAP